MPSHHVQLQDGLYFCDPHNFPHANEWIRDPTSWQTCYEFDLNHKLSKKLINVSTPS